MRTGALLVTDARVWASPHEPIGNPTSILIEDGSIRRIASSIEAHPGVRHLHAGGRVVTAGFTNCHVHLMGPAWTGSSTAASDELQESLDDMFLRRGFTTVWDLSSNPRTTFALMRRIASGEVHGPEVLTATTGLTPWRGMPYYVRAGLPWYLRWTMPSPPSALAARIIVSAQIRSGAALTKLFTGSYVRPGRVKPMKIPVAQAAVAAAHRYGVPVFAHPSNRAGTEVAVRSGVDALAHLPDDTLGADGVLRLAAERGIRIIPTLQMFASTVSAEEGYLEPLRRALRDFRSSGGRVLFGTDVGYLPDTDPRGEYEALYAAGMSASDILQSLTTEPASFLGRSDRGTVREGQGADLVVLETLSMPRPSDFADVHATVRAGRVVFERG